MLKQTIHRVPRHQHNQSSTDKLEEIQLFCPTWPYLSTSFVHEPLLARTVAIQQYFLLMQPWLHSEKIWSNHRIQHLSIRFLPIRYRLDSKHITFLCIKVIIHLKSIITTQNLTQTPQETKCMQCRVPLQFRKIVSMQAGVDRKPPSSHRCLTMLLTRR